MLVNAISGGGPSIEKPCGQCGDPTKVLASMAHLGPAMCDDCMTLSVTGVYETHVGVTVVGGRIRQDRHIDTSTLPDLPAHPLVPDLAAYLAGTLTRIDGEPARGVIVYGPTGSGKSCQVAELGRQYAIRHQRSVLYRTEGELLDRLRSFEDGEHHAEKHRLRTTSLLIIDDVGTHKATDFVYQEYFSLLDERYRNNGRVILGTNYWLTPKQAEDAARAEGLPVSRRALCLPELPQIDDRLWRRIQALCHPVKLLSKGTP